MGDFHELTERLLNEVALSGLQGLSAQQFETIIRDHYEKKDGHPTQHESEDAEDLLFSEAPPFQKTTVNDELILSALRWLREHADIEIQDDDGPQEAPLQTGPSPSALENALLGKRIFASEDRIWHAIAGHGIDHRRVPPHEFEVLAVVAAHGPAGIIQPQVVKLTGQDKRSVPQRTDKLAAKGYIIKENVLAAGCRTSNLKLKRYANVASATETPVPQAEGNGKQRALVNYDQWFDRSMQFLKDNKGIVSVPDLQKHLGFTGGKREKKVLRESLRRIARTGCIRGVLAKVCDADGNQLYHIASGKEQSAQSIQLLREPTAVDRDTWSKSPWKNRQKGDDSSDEDIAAAVDAAEPTELDQDEMWSNIAEDYDGLASCEQHGPPQWTPDTPLVNLIYDIVEAAGPDGISTTQLANRLTGQAWRRPLDQILVLLTSAWQISQPAHLRHLSIVRDTTVQGKMSHFCFRTYENFQKAVDAGKASWKSVIDKKKKKGQRKVARDKLELDEWGFPAVANSELADHQMAGSSSSTGDQSRSKRVVNRSTELDDHCEEPQTPPAPSLSAVQGQSSRRARRSEVYIDPPGSREMKRKHNAERGRPRKALIVVIRLASLHDFEWFRDDRAQQYAPLPLQKRRKDFGHDESGLPVKRNRRNVSQDGPNQHADDSLLRTVSPTLAQTPKHAMVTSDSARHENDTESNEGIPTSTSSTGTSQGFRNQQHLCVPAAPGSSRTCDSPNQVGSIHHRSMLSNTVHRIASSDKDSREGPQSPPIQKATREDTLLDAVTETAERSAESAPPPTAAQRLKALKSRPGRRSKATLRQIADLERQVAEENRALMLQIQTPLKVHIVEPVRRASAMPREAVDEPRNSAQDTAAAAYSTIATTAGSSPLYTDQPTHDASVPGTAAGTPSGTPAESAETRPHLKKGNFTVSDGKLIEVFDKAYVQERPNEVFHHRGHGRYARGSRPAQSVMPVQVAGTMRHNAVASFQSVQPGDAGSISQQPRPEKDTVAAPTPGANVASAPIEKPTDVRSQEHKRAEPIQGAVARVQSAIGVLSSPLRIIRPYSDAHVSSMNVSNTSTRSNGTNHPATYDVEVDNTNPVAKPATGFRQVSTAATARNENAVSTEESLSEAQILRPNPPVPAPAPATGQSMGKVKRAKRTGGLKFAQRLKTILDALTACDGVFPGYYEMWCVCTTAWKRLYDQTPARSTIEDAIKHLSETQKLKTLEFEVFSSKRRTVQRSILLAPEVDPDSSKVKELQSKIIDAYPAFYLPTEVDIDEEMRSRNDKLGKKAVGSETDDDAPAIVPAKPKSMFVRDPTVVVRQSQESSSLEAEQARQLGFSNVLAYREHLVREAKAKKVTHQAGYNTKRNLGPKTPIPALPNKPLGSLRNNVRQTRKARRPRDVEGGTTLEDEASARMCAASLLHHPAQTFHNATGTFGTASIVVDLQVPEVRTLRNRVVVLSEIAEQSLGHVSSALPDDLLGILRRAPRCSDGDRAEDFFKEVEYVQAWEEKLINSAEGVRRDHVFINHTLNRPLIRQEEEVEAQQASTTLGTATRPLITQSLLTPSVAKRTLTGTRKYTSRNNAALSVQNDEQKSDSDFVPVEPALKKRRIRARYDGGGLMGRDRKSSSTLALKDDKRLMVAIALVTTVCGGINLFRLPWNLVAHAMSFHFDGQFYRRRWDHYKRSWSNELNRLRSRIREAFLVAYERDELPTIDFQDPSNTDWPWLLDWVQQEVVPCMGSVETSDVPNLLQSRELTKDRFDVQEKAPIFRLNADEGFSNLTEVGRKHYAVRYTHAIPLNHQTESEADDAMVLRSWIRAIVTAKQKRYNAEAAAAKLKATFSDHMIEQISAEMVESRIVSQEKKGRQLPGRNFVIHNDVLSQFRRWPTKPEEHRYLRAVANAWKKINRHLRSNEQLQLVAAASDSEYLVLTNLVAQGQIKPTAMLPPVKTEYDATFPKLSPWGYGGASYESKKIKTDVLQCPITYVRTGKYQSDHGLTSGVPIPLVLPKRPGEAGERIPFWVDIHGNLIEDIWDMVVRSIINLIVYRPGSTALKMQECHNNKVWHWEIEMVLDWMEKTGIAARCGADADVDGIWTGGWTAGEWWYCAFTPEIASWQSPAGS